MRGRREAGRALAGVLIGLGVLMAILIVAIVGGGLYVAHNVRVERTRSSQGKMVRVETPMGSLRVQDGARLGPKELGVAIYPGAAPAGDGAKTVNLEFGLGGDGKQFDVVAAELTTADPVEKVAEFYRKECPTWSYRSKPGGAVEIKLSDRGVKRVVVISPRSGGARITVAQFGAPAVN